MPAPHARISLAARGLIHRTRLPREVAIMTNLLNS
jgi:hypothetical protein